MTDIRTQLPECPLEYEVPFIPGNHTSLSIPITAADIDWQEKMLPWTLASLINNTDLIMKGVHLYIACEDGTQDSIKNAVSNFSFPSEYAPIIRLDTPDMLVLFNYRSLYRIDVNYWAFRDASNTHKLELADTLKHNRWVTAAPYPDISEVPPDPQLYDMKFCTIEQFRHAMKQLLGAQLAMKV